MADQSKMGTEERERKKVTFGDFAKHYIKAKCQTKSFTRPATVLLCKGGVASLSSVTNLVQL